MTDQTRTALDDLPGDLLMWVLIISELLVFGAGLIVFLSVRITDPTGFAEAQNALNEMFDGKFGQKIFKILFSLDAVIFDHLKDRHDVLFDRHTAENRCFLWQIADSKARTLIHRHCRDIAPIKGNCPAIR